MRFKNLVIAIMGLLFISSLVIAQPRGNRMSVEDQMKEYNEKLNLDEDQFKSIEKILTDMRAKMEEERENMSGDFSNMREKMMELIGERDKKIKEVLNDDQKIEFDKMLEERRKQMEERRRNRGF